MSSWLTCVIGMERQEAEAPDTTYSHELDNLQFYLKFCFLWQIFKDRPNLMEKLHRVLPPVNVSNYKLQILKKMIVNHL